MRSTTASKDKVAFVDINGNLVDAFGGTGVSFFNVNTSESYYVLLRHRNHLDIMSANILDLAAETPYDFTSPSMVMGGSNQLADMGSGNYAMAAGGCGWKWGDYGG